MVPTDDSERPHLAVVEDEPVTSALFASYLTGAGYRVSTAGDGPALRALLARGDVDLVLLDVELPGEDGFSLAATLRATSRVGLIFVTRRTEVVDRIVGLEIGADDYVTKPPDLRELLARVRAVLRRRTDPEAAGNVPVATATSTRFGDWSLDRSRRCLVSPAGVEVAVTAGEIAVLAALLDAGGRVVPREAFVTALAGDPAPVNARSLDVLVHRLRRKLGEGGAIEPRILLTVHGVGYRLGVVAGDDRV